MKVLSVRRLELRTMQQLYFTAVLAMMDRGLAPSAC